MFYPFKKKQILFSNCAYLRESLVAFKSASPTATNMILQSKIRNTTTPLPLECGPVDGQVSRVPLYMFFKKHLKFCVTRCLHKIDQRTGHNGPKKITFSTYGNLVNSLFSCFAENCIWRNVFAADDIL